MATIGNDLGIGSGLPLKETLAKLRTVEEQPLLLLQQQNARYTSQLAAYKSVQASVTALQAAASALQKPSITLNQPNLFGATTASVSGGEGILSASTGDNAIAGQYSVKVERLASRGTISGSLDASLDRYIQNGSGGSITFKLKGDAADAKPRTLDLQDTSLEGIVKAINDDKSLGVRATIINDGTTNHLQLTAADTGEKADIDSITVDGNDAVKTKIFDKLTTVTAAQTAQISLNGITVNSDSNTLDKVIEGVTLTLTDAAPDKILNLKIEEDIKPASDGIKAFVNAYNAILAQIDTHTKYNADSEDRSTDGVLSGDYSVRSIHAQIQGALSTTLSDGEIRTLYKLGIAPDPKTGKLEIDEDKLTDALKNHSADAAALFQSDNGVVAQTKKVTENLLSTNGIFANTTAGIEKTQKNLSAQFDATKLRIDETMAVYQAKFVALDKLVAQMSSTSTYLTQQLSILNGSQNSKK